MALHRLLGLRVGVPDPDGLAAFYGELGLRAEGGGAFASPDGGTDVVLEHAPFRRLLGLDLGAGTESDLAMIEERLDSLGLNPGRRDGALTVVDPASRAELVVRVAPPLEPQRSPGDAADATDITNAPGAVRRRNRRAPSVGDAARAPRRLGHVVVATPDPAVTRSVLVDGLGFRVSDEVPGIISFLRCSTDHHNVALVEAPVPFLQHYSWECDDVDHVGHAATALLRADPERHVWGFGRHHIGSNFFWYLRDPSGSFIELYSDMDVIDDDDEWERDGRTPVGPAEVADAWGPPLPLEFIVPADLPELEAGWAEVTR